MAGRGGAQITHSGLAWLPSPTARTLTFRRVEARLALHALLLFVVTIVTVTARHPQHSAFVANARYLSFSSVKSRSRSRNQSIMAEQAMSRGALRSIFTEGSDPVHQPILQCVQIKSMDNKVGEERYRLVLSDMDNFIQSMLAQRNYLPRHSSLLVPRLT